MKLCSAAPAVFGAATEVAVMPLAGSCTTRRSGLTLLLPAATPAATVKVRGALVWTGVGAEMLVNRPEVVGACGSKAAKQACISIGKQWHRCDTCEGRMDVAHGCRARQFKLNNSNSTAAQLITDIDTKSMPQCMLADMLACAHTCTVTVVVCALLPVVCVSPDAETTAVADWLPLANAKAW